MMNSIEIEGIIEFDPKDRTRKHEKQSSWKRMAIVQVPGDVCEYYAWFIQKRFNLVLNKPIRGSHVSFISDRITDLRGSSDDERLALWQRKKDKWNHTKVSLIASLDQRTDGEYWWLRIECDQLKRIRKSLGLSEDPYYPMHLTIGYANEKNGPHARYIHRLIQNKIIA